MSDKTMDDIKSGRGLEPLGSPSKSSGSQSGVGTETRADNKSSSNQKHK